MIRRDNFAELHRMCGNALQVYEDAITDIQDPLGFLLFQVKWLLDHKRLFCFIIIKPKGLPSLLFIHPKEFIYFREFYELYLNINDGITSDDEMENYYLPKKN